MNRLKVEIIKLKPEAKIPVYSSACAAGADLYAAIDSPANVAAGETVMVGTGIAAAIPEGYVGLVFARSGLASKRGLAPANKVGVIDSDYRGEIIVSLHNHTNTMQSVEAGERIAQLVIVPYICAEFEEKSALDPTERGSGGFGSTGKK